MAPGGLKNIIKVRKNKNKSYVGTNGRKNLRKTQTELKVKHMTLQTDKITAGRAYLPPPHTSCIASPKCTTALPKPTLNGLPKVGVDGGSGHRLDALQLTGG